jgi:hypothetical protein
MNHAVELSRRTWNAAVKLAIVMSIVAALVAVTLTSTRDVPQAAIVLPMIVIAFTASWIQSGRMRREPIPARPTMLARR